MIGRFEVFTFALSELSQCWSKIATEEMKPYGLKGACIVYLIALYKSQDGLTAAELCKICNKDKADVSRAISAMEKKGMVERTGGYRAPIVLTEAGRNATYALRERVKLVVEAGGKGLTDENRENFYNALDMIASNLKEISRKGLSK